MIHLIALLVKALSLKTGEDGLLGPKLILKTEGKKKKTEKMNFFWNDKMMRVRV